LEINKSELQTANIPVLRPTQHHVIGQGGHGGNDQGCGGRHVSEWLDGGLSKFVGCWYGDKLRNAMHFPSHLGKMGIIVLQINS